MAWWLSIALTALAVAVPAAVAIHDHTDFRSSPITATRFRVTTTQRITALVGFLVLIIIAQFLLSLGNHTTSNPACANGLLTVSGE
jgi:hypothetical protein